jgi:hypothetical protein
MRGAIPPLPQYVFMACSLVKHRDNFTFTFTVYILGYNKERPLKLVGTAFGGLSSTGCDLHFNLFIHSCRDVHRIPLIYATRKIRPMRDLVNIRAVVPTLCLKLPIISSYERSLYYLYVFFRSLFNNAVLLAGVDGWKASIFCCKSRCRHYCRTV